MVDSPGEIFERVASRAQSAASQLRVRSALNPMLWLCGIVSVPCFFFSYLMGDNKFLATLIAVVGIAPIATTILGFLYFMIFAPEKLQSEEYQLRHQTLELIREKGSPVAVAPSSLEAIANPVYDKRGQV